MQPAGFRKLTGFLALSAASTALIAASPALAAPLLTTTIAGFAPYAVTVGAAGFGLVATLLALKWRREADAANVQASEKLASLRAALDEVETLVAGMPEVSILWKDSGLEPVVRPGHHHL